jgi:PBP1b-binding outer membrane lipoprotein LpoB
MNLRPVTNSMNFIRRWQMKKLTILLIASLLLTGCAQTVYRTQLEIYCPKIKQYDDRFNNQLADELESLPAASTAIDEAVKNYIYLRDRIRRCEEEKDKI